MPPPFPFFNVLNPIRAVGMQLTQLFILLFGLVDKWVYLRKPGEGKLHMVTRMFHLYLLEDQ